MLEAPAQRRTLSFTIALTAATIGVIYGYDTGSIAGALLFIPARFNLSTGATEWVATFTGIGLIVGALAANRIADRYGRRIAMIALTIGFWSSRCCRASRRASLSSTPRASCSASRSASRPSSPPSTSPSRRPRGSAAR